ncbi:uncharacterized protein ACR2FA_003322 [Aphomia sociella]
MVEAVGTCTSSHISREQSPNTPTSRGTPRRFSKDTTPRSTRTNQTTPRKSQTSSPLNRLPTQCPKAKNRRSSPTNPNRQKVNANGIINNIQDTKESSHVQISPVSKIDCSKKERKQEHEDVKVDVKIVDSPRPKPKAEKALQVEKKSERDRNKTPSPVPARCEVTRIVTQLCGGDAAGSRNERISGAKNAQLVCISGGSPRQPSTPQLLRILEETIQKKIPKPLFQKPPSVKDTERFRLTFNISEETADKIFQYRTKFVQHMITSPMYANSVIGRPWDVIGR